MRTPPGVIRTTVRNHPRSQLIQAPLSKRRRRARTALRTRLPSAACACLVTRIAPATCPGVLTTAADRSRTASAGRVVDDGRWTSRVSRVRRETHPEALQARRHRFATAGRACWLPTLIGAVGRGTRGAVLQRQDNRRRMRFPRDGHGRSDTTLPELAARDETGAGD